jgi:hypothetical protein
MGSLSAARKIGMAARMVTQHAGRSRIGGALLSGARATAATFGRILHILWLEVTGFIFLCLGTIGALSGVREYNKLGTGQANLNKVWAAGIFAVLFAYFGITSFWRARKKRI